MRAAQFAPILERDGYRCYHCGTTETLVPQHRLNRGMGGSKRLNLPSNLITLCSAFNGLVEADTEAAALAKAMGWKLTRGAVFAIGGADFTAIPVWDWASEQWFYLDNSFGRRVVNVT